MKTIWFEITCVIDATNHASEVAELFMSILEILGESCGQSRHEHYSC